jgi:hypothetical protein
VTSQTSVAEAKARHRRLTVGSSTIGFGADQLNGISGPCAFHGTSPVIMIKKRQRFGASGVPQAFHETLGDR